MDPDRPSITALVERFRDTVAARDEAGLLQLLDVYTEEMARALQLDRQTLIDKMLERWRIYFADDPVRVVDLDLGKLRLDSSAGGRLVQVLAEDGSPPIQVVFGDDPLEIPLWVSNLGGQWTIVR